MRGLPTSKTFVVRFMFARSDGSAVGGTKDVRMKIDPLAVALAALDCEKAEAWIARASAMRRGEQIDFASFVNVENGARQVGKIVRVTRF